MAWRGGAQGGITITYSFMGLERWGRWVAGRWVVGTGPTGTTGQCGVADGGEVERWGDWVDGMGSCGHMDFFLL